MSLQGSLSIERMCQMVPVSRRGFYRSLKPGLFTILLAKKEKVL
jgi:hypothetical protein